MIYSSADKLPIFYRLGLSERLSASIMQRKAANIIGMPAVGKSTYINFFTRVNKEFLKDGANRSFTTFNSRLFMGNTVEEFKETFLLSTRSIGQAGIKYDQKIIFIEYLDEIKKDIFDGVLNFLQSLRQTPFNFDLYFLSCRPLKDLTSNYSLAGKMFGSEIYMTPSNYQDFKLELAVFSEQLELSLSASEIDLLYSYTGGHSVYTRVILSNEKVERLALRKSLFEIEDIFQNEVMRNELLNRTREILGALKEDEMEILKQTSSDNYHHEIPQYLTDTGYVLIEDSKPEIFSEILKRIPSDQEVILMSPSA